MPDGLLLAISHTVAFGCGAGFVAFFWFCWVGDRWPEDEDQGEVE